MGGNKIGKVLPGLAPGPNDGPGTALVPFEGGEVVRRTESNITRGNVAPPGPERTGRVARDLQYVTREQVKAAVATLPEQRWRALVRFLWLSGARVSEALAVTVGDIDTRTNVVHLTTLKRQGHRRAVPLPQTFVAELLYLAAVDRRELGERLWTVRREQVFKRVQAALLSISAKRSVAHPHALRHGHAIYAIRRGASLDLIAANLGHASTETSSHYLQATASDVAAKWAEMDWED